MGTHSIKHILVPVDFSEYADAAVEQAVVLARLLGAKLSLLHVVEYNGYFFEIIPESKPQFPSLLEIEEAVKIKLDGIANDLRIINGIEVHTLVTTGKIYSEILQLADVNGADLIVMGTHGASGYKEHFIGSNAQRVITLSKIPVLTIQQVSVNNAFKKILVPIDTTLHSREKVNIAITFAKLFGAEVHLIGLPDSGDDAGIEEMLVMLHAVETVLKDMHIAYTTSIVPGKNLSVAAMTYAKENHCDLIVINTGHESLTNGIFFGTFAQQIVNHSSIAVLSFKHSVGELEINTDGYGI